MYGIAHFLWAAYCSICYAYHTYVALVRTYNTRGVYNFITKEANVPVNLVPFINYVSLLFYHFLKSGVTNVLKNLFL